MLKSNTLIVEPTPAAAIAGTPPLRLQLEPGDVGTDTTVAAMLELVRDAAPQIDLPKAWRSKKYLRGQLYSWLQFAFRFRADVRGQERLQNPLALWAQLRNGPVEGDCDDLTALACTILAAAGIPCSIIVVGKKAGAPFQHVFYGIGAGTGITDQLPADVRPFDPQENTPPGRMPPGVQRVRVYPVSL